MRKKMKPRLRNASPATRRRTFVPYIETLEDRRVMATDVILEWNDVLLTANAADHARSAPEQGGPIMTARAFAIVSTAMYDAYNSVERMGAPFQVRVRLTGELSSDAAVAQAAHDTLLALFPSQQARFDVALDETMARIDDGPAENRGRVIGAAVALASLQLRADDGVANLMKFNDEYHPKNLPGFHVADPMHPNQGYYAPGAMHIKPFVLESVQQFEARRLDDGTPAGRMAFMQSNEYKLAYEEVFSLGGDGVTTPTTRTPEQTEIGIYWGYDGRPGLGTPPRLYNQIARTVAIQQNNSVADNARLFALLNIAQSDAGLAAWKNKYDDDFWRPICGIRDGEDDGNAATQGVADWTPLGAPASNPRPGDTNFTPPFPAYTSGHATFGAAAFQTLERFYGRDDIQFSFVSDELNGITRDADGSTRPIVARTFDSFTEAKLENGQSRIYLGIHWAFDRDDGIKTGDAAADFIFDHTMRPKSPPSDPLRHNSFDPEDVNDDGRSSPVDALLVINVLNSGSVVSTDYIDVDDNDILSPIDALMVINRITLVKQPEADAEGEGPTAAFPLTLWIAANRDPVVASTRNSVSSPMAVMTNAPSAPVPFDEPSRASLDLATRRMRLKPATENLESDEFTNGLTAPLAGF